MCKPLKIGYVLKRFPRLSETFILNEILELERLGAQIQIYSLIDVTLLEAESLRHGLVRELKSPVAYLTPRQPLKKWRVKVGRFDDSGFVQRSLKEICGGDVPHDSILLLLAALVGNLAKAQGVGHLHAHFGTEATHLAMLVSRLAGVPYSFTAHAKDIYDQSVDGALLRQKIREAKFVVTVSDYNRRHLAELVTEETATKLIRLYNGIDLDRFQPDQATLRKSDLILAVGRLEQKKGFQDLIQACALLGDTRRPAATERQRGESVRCLIVGEGRERQTLENEIRRLSLGNQVVLAGAQTQEQLIETFKLATVLVLPCVISSTGDRDALPTVLLEAMAAGLPVISTRLAGIPEIIEDGKTGLLVPPGEPAQLARAIAEVLDHPELQRSFGRAGRAKVERLFDLRKNVPVLFELFSRSLAGEEILHLPVPRRERAETSAPLQ